MGEDLGKCKVCGKRIIDHTEKEKLECIKAVWRRVGIDIK